MEEDLISILVSVYNMKAWLPDCLDSIAVQTWSNWEAILVDDGATDGSGEICDRYAAGDSRFRVVHQEDKGVADARNVALSLAKGKYVCFLDADDYIHPRALELLHSAICSGPYRLAGADYLRVTERREWEAAPPEGEVGRRIVNGRDCQCDCVDGRHIIKWVVVWNKLMERSLIADLRFDDIAQEDALFMFRVYRRLDVVIHIDFPLYAYLDRRDSLSAENYYLGLRSDVILSDRMLHYCSCNTWEEARILKKVFRRYLTSRFHCKGGNDRNDWNDIYRPFFRQYIRAYYANKEIPFREKLVFSILYLNPWAVWVFMKLTGN